MIKNELSLLTKKYISRFGQLKYPYLELIYIKQN